MSQESPVAGFKHGGYETLCVWDRGTSALINEFKCWSSIMITIYMCMMDSHACNMCLSSRIVPNSKRHVPFSLLVESACATPSTCYKDPCSVSMSMYALSSYHSHHSIPPHLTRRRSLKHQSLVTPRRQSPPRENWGNPWRDV